MAPHHLARCMVSGDSKHGPLLLIRECLCQGVDCLLLAAVGVTCSCVGICQACTLHCTLHNLTMPALSAVPSSPCLPSIHSKNPVGGNRQGSGAAWHAQCWRPVIQWHVNHLQYFTSLRAALCAHLCDQRVPVVPDPDAMLYIWTTSSFSLLSLPCTRMHLPCQHRDLVSTTGVRYKIS